MEEVRRNLQEILVKQGEVEKKIDGFKEAITSQYKVLDSALAEVPKQKKELSRLNKSIAKLKASASYDNAAAGDLDQQIDAVRASIANISEKYAPETGSLFVRLFLGQVNVKAYREGERFLMKNEYEKFKRKTNPQFLLFVVLLFFYPHSPFINTIWQIWLLYYYTTLALRENILRVNGSTIKPWWIIHHYLSILGSLAMLLWPLDEAFKSVSHLFVYFSGAQGLVQILINRYQQRQLYKMVAMGKAKPMDVPGEAEGWIKDYTWTPSVMVLLPFLLSVQSFQVYLSYEIFGLMSNAKRFGKSFEWQVPVLGFIFLVLGIGNLTTTISTYIQKFKAKKPKALKKTS